MKQKGKKTIVCVLLCVLVCMVSAFALAGCKKTEAPKKYSVIFMNGDTQISEQTVEANKEAVKPADPTKESSVSTVYTFAGWALTADGEVVTDFTIKADTTFYAVYTPSTRKYTVKFMDGENQLSSAEVDYDTQATKPADPTKESSVSTVYTFAGWALTADGEVVTDFTIKADTTFYAVYTPSARKYTVKFMDGENQLSSVDVDYDAQATKPADPTKAADAKYTYTFAGWALTADGDAVTDFKVTGDVTYYAVYTSVVNKYDVKFMLDGEQIGATQNIDYDTAPTMPETPTKAATAEYTYTFAGWYTAAEGGEKVEDFTVKGNATYYGRFTATKNRYEIKFVDGDGKQVEETQTVEYGTAATAPATATKAATDKYTYAFDGWYTAAEGGEKVTDFTVKANATYYAHFTSTVNKYDVKFMSEGQQVGETQSVEYDAKATKPANPTKTGDAQYSYDFEGWYNAAEGGEKVEDFTVKGNATYYARYTRRVNKYTVKFIDGNGEEMTENAQTLDYGSEIELPAEPAAESGYYFAGWKTEGGKFWQESDVLEKNETLTATFEKYFGAILEENVYKGGVAQDASEVKRLGFVKVFDVSALVLTENKGEKIIPYIHGGVNISATDISAYKSAKFAIKSENGFRLGTKAVATKGWCIFTLTQNAEGNWDISVTNELGEVIGGAQNVSGKSVKEITWQNRTSGTEFNPMGTSKDTVLNVYSTELRVELVGEKIVDSLFVGATKTDYVNGYESAYHHVETYEDSRKSTGGVKTVWAKINDVDVSEYKQIFFRLYAVRSSWILFNGWDTYFDNGIVDVKLTRINAVRWTVEVSGTGARSTKDPKVFTFTRAGNNLKDLLKMEFDMRAVPDYDDCVPSEVIISEIRGIKATEQTAFGGVKVDDCALGVGCKSSTPIPFTESAEAVPAGFEKVFEANQSARITDQISHTTFTDCSAISFAIKTTGKLTVDIIRYKETTTITEGGWVYFYAFENADGNSWNIVIMYNGNVIADYSLENKDIGSGAGVVSAANLFWHRPGNGITIESNDGNAFTTYCTEIRGIKKAEA